MKTRFYDIIFVVCTYGVHEDLFRFVESLEKLDISYKVIVANSYCDDKSRENIKKVAMEMNCDFLNLENKGYGYSLNEGIDYAVENYEFDNIVVSNADILVQRMDLSNKKAECFVLAPETITLTGKRQNPFYIFSHFRLFKFSKWYRETFMKENSLIVIVIAKIERIIFNLLWGKRRGCWKKIYAGHGAFILFSKEAIEKIVRPFEDDIFLYCEENFLGYKLKKMGIPFYYSCDVSVIHTEDGSKKFYKHKINEETKKSVKKYHDLIKNE